MSHSIATTTGQAFMAPFYRRMTRDRITFSFVAAATTFMLTCMVSGQALIAMHYDYSFGPIFEKIHPVTYIGMLFLTLQLCFNERYKLLAVASNNHGPFLLAGGAALVAVYAGLYLSVPGTGLPDTWLLPGEIFLLCAQLNARERGLLRNATNVFFVINSLVAIGEVVANRRLIPLAVARSLLGDYEYPIEWRAGAFLGHPLSNGYLTGVFILLLIFDSRIKNFWLRLGTIGICGVSMLAFGSRAATAFLVIFLCFAFLWKMAKTFLTGKISTEFLIYIYGGLFGVVGIAPALLASGFADRFLNRFAVDHGSASARTGALDLASSLSFSQLITGIPRLEMLALGTRFNIGDGIENFWLSFLITFGLIGYALLMPGLFVFCRNLVRSADGKLVWVLVYFFACCTTSVSLSSKSLTLAIVTGLYLTSRSARPFERPLHASRTRLASDRLTAGQPA